MLATARKALCSAVLVLAAVFPTLSYALPVGDAAIEDQRFHFRTLRALGFVQTRLVEPEVWETFGPDVALLLAVDATVTVRRRAPDEAVKNAIVVDIGERRLSYYRGEFVLEFPVATARQRAQRYGLYRVVLKRDGPTWIPTPNQRKLYGSLPAAVPPGPDNPLGSKALNLSSGNLRIHGTNRPDQIGLAVSDGCVRMFNEHIDVLFGLVEVGDRVLWTE